MHSETTEDPAREPTPVPAVPSDHEFSLLLHHYEQRILRVLRIRNGREIVDVDRATAVLEAALLRALRSRNEEELSRSSSLLRWLCKAAQETIPEGTEACTRSLPKSSESVADEIDEQVRSASTEDEAEVRIRVSPPEEARQIDACVGRLRPKYREILLLRVYEECSWPYVACELGLNSELEAKTMFARAKMELARELGGNRDE